jgi:mannosyltransferase OCH1-like enzyme
MIPRLLHQFWIANDTNTAIPEAAMSNVRLWKDFHPDFTLRTWDYSAVLFAMPRKKRNILREARRIVRFETMFADIARLFILYEFGGVWVDLKIIPLKRWLHGITGENLVLIEHFESEWIAPGNGVLINSCFACCPRNPFIGRCLDLAISNIEARMSSTIWEITGPKVFMDVRDSAVSEGRKIDGLVIPATEF